MKSHTHDIYGTDRRRRQGVELSDTDPTRLLAKPFEEAARQRMISAVIFSLVVILCTAVLVTVIIIYQNRAIKQTPPRWQQRTEASADDALAGRDAPLDSQTLFLLDELKDQRATPDATGKEPPLSGHWIKQAAYHLLQAEKAEREERYEDALARYQQAIEIFPDMKGVHRRIGMMHLKLEDYPKAAEALEKVPMEEELTFGLANNLGVTYLAMNEYEKAEKNLLIASRLNPSYPLAYFNLATLYMRTEEPEKATQFFQKYLDLKPEDVSATQTYALLLLQLKRWEAAIKVLEQVRLAAPEVAPIHFRLAEAYTQNKNSGGAIDALRRGATLVDPRNALVWMSRPEFDPIRNEPGFQDLLKELGSGK